MAQKVCRVLAWTTSYPRPAIQPGQPGGRAAIELQAGIRPAQVRQLGLDPDRDPQLLVGPAERALERAEDLGPDRARGVQPPDELELDPRGALPVQVVGHGQERDRPGSRADRDDRGPDLERLALGVEMRAEVGVDPMAVHARGTRPSRGDRPTGRGRAPRDGRARPRRSRRTDSRHRPADSRNPRRCRRRRTVPRRSRRARRNSSARGQHARRGDRHAVARDPREVELAGVPPGGDTGRRARRVPRGPRG